MNTKKTVKMLLKRSKRLRRDDRLLDLAVWREYGFYLTPEQERIFITLPSAESIARRRRELRSELPEDTATQERRFRRFENFKDNYSWKHQHHWIRKLLG